MKNFVPFFLTFLLLFSFCSCSGQNTDINTDNETFATVNGEIITNAEIDYFKGRNKADIINKYAAEFNITDFSNFWDSDFDGKNPSADLEATALNEAVSAKIRLVLMKENGIYADISFDGLKKQAEEYNESHKNTTTVGIQSIDLSSFYTYYIDTGEMELKNILSKGELKPTDDEIAQCLSENENLTEEGAISVLTAEKYKTYISELIGSAEITKNGD